MVAGIHDHDREVAHQLGYAPGSLIHFRPPAGEPLKEKVVGLPSEAKPAATPGTLPAPEPVTVSLPSVTVVEPPVEAPPVVAPLVETPSVVTQDPAAVVSPDQTPQISAPVGPTVN